MVIDWWRARLRLQAQRLRAQQAVLKHHREQASHRASEARRRILIASVHLALLRSQRASQETRPS